MAGATTWTLMKTFGFSAGSVNLQCCSSGGSECRAKPAQTGFQCGTRARRAPFIKEPRISSKEEEENMAAEDMADENAAFAPDELTVDQDLSSDDKKTALSIWEQDARQMLTASDEGMPGSEEGVSRGDHHQLGQVERAKETLRDEPKRNASRRGG
jgi:hypothetical protein